MAYTFSDLTKKAQDAAIEHNDKIRQAVQKAQVAADQRTGGIYRDQIRRAAERADAFVVGLKPGDGGPAAADASSDVPPKPPAAPRG